MWQRCEWEVDVEIGYECLEKLHNLHELNVEFAKKKGAGAINSYYMLEAWNESPWWHGEFLSWALGETTRMWLSNDQL